MSDRFRRIVNYSLRIENAFIFLQQTYSDIRLDWFNDVDMSKVKTIEDVYVITLCKVVNTLQKRGLYKEYIKIEGVELISPKGRIDVSNSVVRQTRLRGKLICSYDELSDSVLHNKIIKTVLYHMIYNKNVSKDFIVSIQKTLNGFNGIELMELDDINWKRIRFNNSNLRYKTALGICRSMIDIEKISKLTEYDFDDKIYIMFTKHLYNFYYKEYKDKYVVTKLVSANWTSKLAFEKLSNKSRTFTVLRRDKEALIIGFEKYDSWSSANDEDAQLKAMKTICEDYEKDNPGVTTKIGLVYINSSDGYTDKDIQIVNVDGKIAAYTIVDCNIKYNYIKYKLNQLVYIMMKGK